MLATTLKVVKQIKGGQAAQGNKSGKGNGNGHGEGLPQTGEAAATAGSWLRNCIDRNFRSNCS